MAHMANIYARLGMGNRALECMEILSRSSMGPNLFTYHNDWRDMGLSLVWWGAMRPPPFQIDANFGITAAVLEMLVFSKPGLLKLLPALPDKWPTGRAGGIACRGGIIADIEWDTQKGFFRATLVSNTDQTLLLRLPDSMNDWSLSYEGIAVPSAAHGAGYWDLNLSKSSPASIQAER